MAALQEVVKYADEYLRVAEIGDWENALNGLQVENSGEVHKIGAAVDASTRTFRLAAERQIDLLIVHHGLFWPGLRPLAGAFGEQVRFLIRHDVALYSSHLPLDLHPLIGNNAQLAAALALGEVSPCLPTKGQPAGLRAEAQISRSELVQRLQRTLGTPVKAFAFGPEQTRSIGVVTGGAGGDIYRVASEGIDTFITGEAPHWAAVAAEELRINLLLGGHYATETFGVTALAAHLSECFGLPWEFISAATGL